jgi:hypothetical protein
MSTKCSILFNESNRNSYHLYYEQMDGKYYLETNGNGFNLFLQRVGKLLNGCPFADSGIFIINLNGGRNKTFKSQDCPHIKIKKNKKETKK